jgi:hypothetical protein
MVELVVKEQSVGNVTGTCCSHVLAVLAVPAIYSRIAN